VLILVDSMLDGTPTLRLNEFMIGGVDAGKIPLELAGGEKATSPMPKPEEIMFEMDKHMEELVEKSKKGFAAEMALQDLEVSGLLDLLYISDKEAERY